jgi:hypothetical protein
MEDEQQRQRARPLLQAMEDAARPGFDDEDVANLRTLVYHTVTFYDYVSAHPSWPEVPDDSFPDITYVTESILIHVDSFRRTVYSYGVLVGATGTTIDWDAINIGSIKDEFLFVYHAFEKETRFEIKCRLLLDLVKLQLVFAGAYFDCRSTGPDSRS